ncbi:hypothetical protein [Paraburkholderia sp. JHI869]|uniref:T4 family baseplate hub assembly chaperone n=1 Tax=Paraburkholderia sp. JHI869 TaxID=3112959 RepID=UPI003172CC9F
MDLDTLISTWEAALAQPAATRTATLVAVLREGAGDPLALDVGTREHDALRLAACIVGDALDAQTACVHCGERMEIRVPLAALERVPVDTAEVRDGVWQVGLRVPDTHDVLAALDFPAGEASEAALFSRCVRSAQCNSEARTANDLPAALRAQCEARLDALAPLANLTLDLVCPTCGAEDAVPLDAGAFVFERMRHWVEDQLDDVARLCRAYGWREADVLAMSAWRRRFYLARAEAI